MNGAFLFRVLPLLLMGWIMMSCDDKTERLLFNFADAAAANEWRPVNDGVMGGRSDGRSRITDGHTMEFFGTISLENNGGFASVRSVPRTLDLGANDTIVLRVRGDGREYSLNLYLPNRRMATSYRAKLSTAKDRWTEIATPMKEFVETSFGRVVPNAGPVDAAKVNAVGFMLSDKQSGPFRLEVDWIKVRSAADHLPIQD